MPSINFMKQFVPAVEAFLDPAFARRSGIKPKTTTIRKRRKRPFRVGDDLYLFEGLRTPKCRLIGSCICRKAEDITIDEQHGQPVIIIDGATATTAEMQRIATADGFSDIQSMVRWFRVTHGLPFAGQRIHFTTTYNRKYFCNHAVKRKGYKLRMTKTERTIEITPDQVETAANDRHVRELAGAHQYGIQIINPLFAEVEPIK